MAAVGFVKPPPVGAGTSGDFHVQQRTGILAANETSAAAVIAMRVLLRCLAVLPVAVAAAASPSNAATLRVATVLTAPVVHLWDLFDDAGSNAARVLGPAPAPGGRITVEAPQLEAIDAERHIFFHSLGDFIGVADQSRAGPATRRGTGC